MPCRCAGSSCASTHGGQPVTWEGAKIELAFVNKLDYGPKLARCDRSEARSGRSIFDDVYIQRAGSCVFPRPIITISPNYGAFIPRVTVGNPSGAVRGVYFPTSAQDMGVIVTNNPDAQALQHLLVPGLPKYAIQTI